MKIVTFDSLPSTNQYCELLDLNEYEEFTIINAREQTAGIGQRGNHWEAEGGKNLTFSIILKPTFLPIAEQFQLTKCLSLGIADWLRGVIPEGHRVSIKWPNDIYVDLSKICGTLISAKVSGDKMSTAIAGIGINLNQRLFPDWVPNPVSLIQLNDCETDTQTALNDVAHAIEERYKQLRRDMTAPNKDYISSLLHLKEVRKYNYKGETIEAEITGVNRFGHLELCKPSGERLVCQMKEIQWIWQ